MPQSASIQQIQRYHNSPKFYSSDQVKKISFIIADDNIDDQQLIQQAIKLIDQDAEHSSVFNGLQLMDLLQNRGVYATSYNYSPSAVILDLNMPLMDGLAALKKIRSLELCRKIPVYVLHNARQDNYLNQCSTVGVQGIFTKPSSFSALKLIIENIYYSCGGVRAF